MAWRIAANVITGEIDNRIKGRVRGFLELAGGHGRIVLDLEGNAHPDLAGSIIRFNNPRATSGNLENLDLIQRGLAGDITASHRVKDLQVPLKQYLKMDEDARSKAYQWANCLYVEWFGQINGRVVMEGVGFEVQWIEGPLWNITQEDLKEQANRISEGMGRFFEDIAEVMQLEDAIAAEDDSEEVPPAEAEMDAEAARMDLLNERICRRLKKEGAEAWEKIYEEESSRLRRERGEPEPRPLTPEEEAAHAEWIDEINAAGEEALEEAAADNWKGTSRHDHPLAKECREFAMELEQDGMIPKDVSEEHPLQEISIGVLFAAGKLAGALNGCLDEDEWPPDELTAPSVLLFLKKARHYLRDALRGMDSADEEELASKEWRTTTRTRINKLLSSTQQLIVEARQSLLDNKN